jgi:hypothetical protein
MYYVVDGIEGGNLSSMVNGIIGFIADIAEATRRSRRSTLKKEH